MKKYITILLTTILLISCETGLNKPKNRVMRKEPSTNYPPFWMYVYYTQDGAEQFFYDSINKYSVGDTLKF